MKIIYTTLLLFIIIPFVLSCRSQGRATSDLYKSANNQMRKESFLVESNTKGTASKSKQSDKYFNDSAELAYQTQVKSKYDHYEVVYDNSEYANGDIYKEAVKRRQALAAKASLPSASPESGKKGAEDKDNKTSDSFSHLIGVDNKSEGIESFTYLKSEDKGKLKNYNVVIASLSKYQGVELLEKTLGKEEPIIVVRNSAGLYNVIVGSYNTEIEANNRIGEVKRKYHNRYSSAELFKKYGIQFADMWILRK